MVADDSDWRLTGQESYLQGAELVWKRYRARSESWEHDQSEFCWAKIMDPAVSEARRQHIEAHPDVLTEGYTTTAEHEHGADYHWICKPCFEDLAGRFRWQVVPITD